MLSTLRRSHRCAIRRHVRRSGEASVREDVTDGGQARWDNEAGNDGTSKGSESCGTPPMDASMVESRRGEFVDSRVHPYCPHSRVHRDRYVPDSRMESLFVE